MLFNAIQKMFRSSVPLSRKVIYIVPVVAYFLWVKDLVPDTPSILTRVDDLAFLFFATGWFAQTTDRRIGSHVAERKRRFYTPAFVMTLGIGLLVGSNLTIALLLGIGAALVTARLNGYVTEEAYIVEEAEITPQAESYLEDNRQWAEAKAREIFLERERLRRLQLPE